MAQALLAIAIHCIVLTKYLLLSFKRWKDAKQWKHWMTVYRMKYCLFLVLFDLPITRITSINRCWLAHWRATANTELPQSTANGAGCCHRHSANTATHRRAEVFLVERHNDILLTIQIMLVKGDSFCTLSSSLMGLMPVGLRQLVSNKVPQHEVSV